MAKRRKQRVMVAVEFIREFDLPEHLTQNECMEYIQNRLLKRSKGMETEGYILGDVEYVGKEMVWHG